MPLFTIDPTDSDRAAGPDGELLRRVPDYDDGNVRIVGCFIVEATP